MVYLIPCETILMAFFKVFILALGSAFLKIRFTLKLYFYFKMVIIHGLDY